MNNLDEKIIAVVSEKEDELTQRKLKEDKINEFIKDMKTNEEIEQKTFYNEKFKLYLPKYIAEMSKEHIKIKYPNENRPKLLYSNDIDSINIGINIIDDDKFVKEDVKEFRDIMLGAFLSANPSSKEIEKAELEEKNIAYYAFDNFAIGGAMYNFVFVFLIGEALVVVNMNCSIKDMEENEILFNAIMHTVAFPSSKSPDLRPGTMEVS